MGISFFVFFSYFCSWSCCATKNRRHTPPEEKGPVLTHAPLWLQRCRNEWQTLFPSFPVTLFLTRNILTRTQLVFFHILILYIIYTRPPCSHRLCTFMAQSIWLFEPLLLDHKFVPFYLIFRKDVRHFNFFLPNLNLCCCCCCMKKQTIRATQHSFFLISLLNKHRNTWESKDENGHPRRELTPNKNQSPGIWKLILIYTTRGDDVKNRKPYKTIRIPFFTLQRKIWGAPKMELCWNQPSTHRSWCEILSQPGEGRGGAKTLQ